MRIARRHALIILAPDEPGAHMARLIYFMLSRKSEPPLLGDLPHGWDFSSGFGSRTTACFAKSRRCRSLELRRTQLAKPPDFAAVLSSEIPNFRMLLAGPMTSTGGLLSAGSSLAICPWACRARKRTATAT